jgi:signal transduction histidine kinase
MRFRYRLEGLDDRWTEAGNRRAANYSYLPPGDYTFRVVAANSDGVWNEAGASLHIVVVPPFWRTWWFFSLTAAMLGAAAVMIYRRRVSHLHRKHAEQEAFSRQLIESQERERKRIAAELHDSLGQSLIIIKNRALMGLSRPDDQARAIAQMEEISSAASQSIAEVREIARNLHPYQLDRLGLTKAIESIVKKASASCDIGFSMEIDDIDGALSKESEISLYRIVQESINNIMKHAEATSARVSIARNDSGIEVRIEDDGKGFQTSVERRGFGLIGIAERAKMLGADFDIQSQPGKGTTMILKMASR